MPYIKPERRIELSAYPEVQPGGWQGVGELNYLITMLIIDYWEVHGNYQGINDIVGALEGAKLEFYRRIAVPYEDQKREANGDVY